jgi:hypothetical protein
MVEAKSIPKKPYLHQPLGLCYVLPLRTA